MTIAPHSTVPRRRRRFAVAMVAAAGGLALLAGCAQRVSPYEITGSLPENYRTSHPILIEEQIATMDIPVSIGTARLTDPAKSNILGFARSFQASGSAIIAVIAPSGSPNQQAAAMAAVEIENVLKGSGIDPRAIEYRTYRASADERIAPVRIAYNRVAAHTKQCGPWTDQATANPQNRAYGSFGCASQQNLAAMVANPLDLLYPRAMTPADAARRASVLETYRSGGATSSSSDLSGGSIAGVGQ